MIIIHFRGNGNVAVSCYNLALDGVVDSKEPISFK